MVDFWLTVGTLVADEEFLKVVETLQAKKKLKFKPLPETCTDSTGLVRTKASAGLLDKNSTQGFRDAINGFFARKYPRFQVPIGIYTPSSLCRLINLSNPARSLDFLVQVRNANVQLAKLAKAAGIPLASLSTKRFLTLLGAVMIDDALRSEFDGSTMRSRAVSAAFSLMPGDPELAFLPLLSDFLKAVAANSKALDFRENEGWDDGCRELFYWYQGSDRGAN